LFWGIGLMGKKEQLEWIEKTQHQKIEEIVRTKPEIPKGFKARTEYLFYYYKWHAIIVLVVIILAILTIHDISSRPNYDYRLMIVSDLYLMQEDTDLLSKRISELGEDVNGDGQILVSVDPVYLESSTAGDMQMIMAAQAKVIGEVTAGETYLFMFNKTGYDSMFKGQGIFGSDEPNEDEAYFSLKGNSFISDTYIDVDIETNEVFLGLRVSDGLSNKENIKTSYSASEVLYNKIQSMGSAK
jgi:hypothetical protein